MDAQTRNRRDHEKYLTLIDAIALLHQHQRPRKQSHGDSGPVDYIEATLEDVELANHLAGEVLGRSLDELPPQTRRFLRDLDAMVSADCDRLAMDRCDYRFLRRQVADETGWSYAQVRRHIDRLVELEYVIVHRGSRGQSVVYELVYAGEGDDGRRFVPGLIEAAALGTSRSLMGSEVGLTPSAGEFDPSLTAHCRPIDPRLPPAQIRRNLNGHKLESAGDDDEAAASTSRASGSAKSYVMTAKPRHG
jgi:hypothetical protein